MKSKDQQRRPLALITGASSGIGRECARILAEWKWDLIVVGRREDRLRDLRYELERVHGVAVSVVKADLATLQGADQVYQFAREVPSGVEMLINNAGCGLSGAFVESDWNRESAMIVLNIISLTKLLKLILPDMLGKGSGRILNVASTAVFWPGPLLAVYAATKAYVLSLSEGIAAEVAGTGVTVTTLCPGPTLTEFCGGAGGNYKSWFRSLRIASANAVARAGIEGALAGRRIVIPGIANRVAVGLSRALPTRVLSSLCMTQRGGRRRP